MQLNLLLVVLSLIACVYSQTYKLNGNDLVVYSNYKPVCDQVTTSASLSAAVSAELSTLKANLLTDAVVQGYLAGLCNQNAATLASAFVSANAAAQASISAVGNFVTAQAAVKSQIATASNVSIDAVAFAGAVLDKLQARTAVLLKFAVVAATEIDLEVQQGVALSCQELKNFCAAGTGAAYTALKAKIAAGTVVAADIQAILADLQLAANANLLNLLLTARATANIVTGLKAQLIELPRAIVVDATLKAKATAVTAVEAVADIKVKAREFFAAKAAKVTHLFADLLVVFGADVNAVVRLTLTKRLRDMCLDELSDILNIGGITITPIANLGSVEINVSCVPVVGANLTALQERLRLLVFGFVNAHCHPLRIDIADLTSAGISILVRAAGAVNLDTNPRSMCTDDTGASAQAAFIATVKAGIAANVQTPDTDFQAVLNTAALGIAGAISTVDTALTAVGNLITTIDTTLKAAVSATLSAFAKVDLDLVADAVANFETEAFLVADLQARVKLAAGQCRDAYSTLILRVQQDVIDLNITGQYLIRVEATIKKQLLQAINDRFTFLGGLLTGCPNAGSISVTADFNETDIDALVGSNAACVQYGAVYARILSLKRQLLQAIIARKNHASVEASVKASVDLVVAKYTAIQAKLNAEIAANVDFTIQKTDAELKAIWIDAQVDFEARVAACLAVLGKGVFGASISVNVQAVAGVLKHTATCSNPDLSAAVQADVALKLAAYLPICIVQCTGGDGSYCHGKSQVEQSNKRTSGVSASQITYDPTLGFKLAGKALVVYSNYRPVCDQITTAASLSAAVAAQVSTIKAGLSADATVQAYLASLCNGNAAALASAFVTANANAQAAISAVGNFVAAQAAVKTQIATASNVAVDAVAFAGAVLDKLQARTAVLLKFAVVASTEIDLEIQQGFALACQELKNFCANGTGAVYTAIQAKIAAGTVTAADIQTILGDLQLAANANLLDLLVYTRATANVITGLKAQLTELPRAIVVDATLKAKATAVTTAEAVADIKLKARQFFAAKAAKVVHLFADLVGVFGADVNAVVRLTLTKRLRDMCLDELSDVLNIADVTIDLVPAIGSVQINISCVPVVNANLTDLQARLQLLVLGFVNAHCHPLRIDVVDLSSAGISILVRASGAVNSDPTPRSMCTDDTGATAQNAYITDVTAAIAANVDTDFQAVLNTAALGIAGALTTVDTALTAVGNLITTIDTTLKAAVSATLSAFAKVNLDLVANAVVNFETEVFAVADLQARAAISAGQCRDAYSTLLLRVQQDLVDLNITGQFLLRVEATIKKQLLQAMNDRFAFIGGLLTGCPNAGSISVTADFNETDIDALVAGKVACVQYGAVYARILSLKRQLLAAIVARKNHATVEASVKASVDLVVAKYTAIQAKLNAEIAANVGFTLKKTDAELKAIWIDAQVDFKARVAACLAVLGRGVFGASISVDVAADVAGTLKHTVTCSDIDVSAAVKAQIELKLAAYLPICLVQCTGGDGSYCKGKSQIVPTKKRATGASASQVTTDPSTSTTGQSTGAQSTAQSTGQSTGAQSTGQSTGAQSTGQSTGAQSTGQQSTGQSTGVQSTSQPVSPSGSAHLAFSMLFVMVAVAMNLLM